MMSRVVDLTSFVSTQYARISAIQCEPRPILKQLQMWLVEVVNTNKQLSVSKKFCFKYRISMIKAHEKFVFKFTMLKTLNSDFLD